MPVPLRAPRPRRSSPTLPSAALRYRQVAVMSNDRGESAGRDRFPSGPRSPLRYIHDLIASSSWPTRAAPWPWLLKVLSSRIGTDPRTLITTSLKIRNIKRATSKLGYFYMQKSCNRAVS
ncbi:hypothetical protein PVAP13_1KG393100 [Panicum virgatum]|uniref:Uncharacterized protein n=1 Tax=Panicum virgatum TaxID=38727 RepID=A0A8T0XM29_PANVG|nr:hypothetical protein PVAP13_1KG393100 [Panicum virgatum]